MNENSVRWKKNWSKTKNPPLFEVPHQFHHWGDESPTWFASLSHCLGDHFRDGMTVLDYGCGSGRYLNFIHQRLEEYNYYGLDKRGGYSEIVVNILNRMTTEANANNIKFGFLGEDLENEALEKSDVVILGSIFTHLKFDLFVEIFDKFIPLIDRGGVVSFSVFLADEEYVIGPSGAYGLEDCWPLSYYTLERLEGYFEAANIKVTEEESFIAQEVNKHRIFRAEK